MSGTTRPEDLTIGAFGQNYLGKTKALVAGASAVTKGDAVLITALNFDDSRGIPRSASCTRSDDTPLGLVLLAAHDAAVGRQVTMVDWLPFQMDTTGATIGDPVYIAADGSPSLAVTTVIIGAVVAVGTVANGGCVILKSPGIVQ